MPYVEVNCAAIPSELIESELFGHEKGSFTSAIKQHKGKFEQADGGTLFLDEIGDMSLAAQAKVLRVLQEKKLSRVGSDKDINVDVRVLAATNKNLKEEIAKGTFREDLYHRLSVIVIKVPSLDERKSDIPLLVDHFIDQICSETGMQRRKVEPAAMQLLMDKSWTGNIRELRNVVERLLILEGRVVGENVSVVGIARDGEESLLRLLYLLELRLHLAERSDIDVGEGTVDDRVLFLILKEVIVGSAEVHGAYAEHCVAQLLIIERHELLAFDELKIGVVFAGAL